MTDLTGIYALKWLADHGGQFCKVAAWNSSGASPGKAAIEDKWQNKPYKFETIQAHIKSGGNVGLLCGSHSLNLSLLDIDERFTEFNAQYPNLAAAPAIVRDNPDKGKVIIFIDGPMPKGKKFYHEGEKHPFLEWLSNGNQGVIPPSRHPSGEYYRLINSENPIPILTPAQISAICVLWAGAGLDLPTEKTAQPKTERRELTPGSDLKAQVLQVWTPLKVFEYHGWVSETRQEKHGEEIRILGHGGLFCNVDSERWNLPGEEGTGGGAFEAWQYCKTGESKIPREQFKGVLLAMAEAGGIEIPEFSGNGYHQSEDIQPPDNFDGDPQDETTPRRKPIIGEKLDQETAAEIEARAHAIPCPDPALLQRVTDLLIAPKIPVKIKRQRAGALVLNWLITHGEFVRSEAEDIYYLYKPEKKLYNLLTNHWRAWLYSLTGANPAGTDYAHFQADCETAGMLANPRPVLKLAAWDKKEQVLRVSRFDGTVYRLDGETITEEGNGENILFDDGQYWQPYKPDFTRPGVFAFMADSYFDGDPQAAKEKDEKRKQELNQAARERYRLALRAWELSIFFTELCPTRPALAIIGEKGSGKSMTLRRFLRSLYGHNAELSGVPDKQDGFTAAAAAAHVYVIDNLDEFHGWMRDKISRLTTGGIDEYRRLYTSNEVGRVIYRCWLAFTSRTPDTLRRDDLADRLILLPVKTIPEQYLKAERSFLDAAELTRDAWWGDVLTRLNGLIADIRAGKLQSKARLRMADWESFGRLVAAQEKNLDAWDGFVDRLKKAQTDFLLEGEIVAEELLEWLEKHPEKAGEPIRTSILYEQLSEKFSGHKPPKDWPTSVKSFGRRLQMIREALKKVINIEWEHDKYTGWNYTFSQIAAESEES